MENRNVKWIFKVKQKGGKYWKIWNKKTFDIYIEERAKEKKKKKQE